VLHILQLKQNHFHPYSPSFPSLRLTNILDYPISTLVLVLLHALSKIYNKPHYRCSLAGYKVIYLSMCVEISYSTCNY